MLIFDEVWFVDPVSKTMRENLMYERYLHQQIIEDWIVVKEEYSLLSEKGVIRFFDPTRLILDCDKTLTLAFESDVKDDEVWKLFLEYYEEDPFDQEESSHSWDILKERIPPSVFTHFRDSWAPGYITYVMEQAKLAFGQPASQVVWRDRIPAHVAPELKERAKEGFFVKASPKEIFDIAFRWIHSDSEVSFRRDTGQSSPKDFAFSCKLPYVNGSSLVVNQAMLIGELLGAALVTDSEVHHQLLALKYSKATKYQSSLRDSLPGLKASISAPELLKYTSVAMNILDIFAPDEFLEQITLKQCLQYREASGEPLQRLRQYLWELTDEVESNPWDKALERDIRKIINQKILPEANHVKDQMLELRSKLFGSLIVTLSAVTIPSLIATFFPGMSHAMILLFASSAAAGGSIALASEEIKEAIVKNKQVKQSGLSYLIKLSKHR